MGVEQGGGYTNVHIVRDSNGRYHVYGNPPANN